MHYLHHPVCYDRSLPVFGSMGVTGHRARATLLPSSCNILNVDAALRYTSARRVRYRWGLGRLAESMTSSWIPRPEMYSLISLGGGTTDIPVPNTSISTLISVYVYPHLSSPLAFVHSIPHFIPTFPSIFSLDPSTYPKREKQEHRNSEWATKRKTYLV